MGKFDDIVCSEFIKPRKLKSQNIIHRIRDREGGPKKPGLNTYTAREFYQNIFPNLTVFNVEKPPCK
jgi:de-etiolated-1